MDIRKNDWSLQPNRKWEKSEWVFRLALPISKNTLFAGWCSLLYSIHKGASWTACSQNQYFEYFCKNNASNYPVNTLMHSRRVWEPRHLFHGVVPVNGSMGIREWWDLEEGVRWIHGLQSMGRLPGLRFDHKVWVISQRDRGTAACSFFLFCEAIFLD